mmetsp:Transcript_19213/g.62568  ORF Transcript_19213/g.62568 Transcript_19213/m.62568 type:complete len:346 (-) Transcript_19213:309-1346(-)
MKLFYIVIYLEGAEAAAHGGGGDVDFVERAVGVCGARLAGEDRPVEVGVRELDALDVLLLVHEEVAVVHELVDGHGRLFKLNGSGAGVDEVLGEGFVSRLLDPRAHAVVVDARAERAEKVDRLPLEGVDEALNVVAHDVVLLEDAARNADAVLARRAPVKLLHASVADERGVERGKVVARRDDRHARDLLHLVLAGELHVGGVIGDVHERGVHHLVVHGVLRRATHAPGARVEIVDEERRHFALLDDVRRLLVALAHKLGGLAGVAALELTSAHHDREHAELLEHEVALERLTLALAAPHAEDERDLDLRQVEEVLHNVQHHLVHEGGRDVEAVGVDVVKVFEAV